jgi:hypothetical protein
MRFLSAFVLALGSTLFMVASAAAQRADTSRAFVEGGIYDRPYLTRLLGRTAIGGYAEAHARWVRADGVTEEAGFLAKRFNLFTATQVSDWVRVGAEVEFEEGGEEIRLEYAAIDVLVHPAFAIRGGMILSPLGRFNLAHDSPLNPFTDRPLVSTEILGVALSEPGLGVLGSIRLGEVARVTYELYGVNGFNAGVLETSSGTRIPDGRANLEDNNASPAFVGRVAWSPNHTFELGASAHHGAYNVFERDGGTVDDRRNLSIAVIDIDATVAGFRLSGEAARAEIDIPASLEDIAASRQRGAYLDIVRQVGAALIPTMPSSFFLLKARFEAVDFDGDAAGQDIRQFGLGLTFHPTRDTALKLDYTRGRSRDRFSNSSDHAGIFFSIATYF